MTDTPDVYPWQRDILSRYPADLWNNTGGNDPAELLQDLQRRGTDERPNRLMSVNVVRFTLAVAVAAQVSLIAELERRRVVHPPEVSQ